MEKKESQKNLSKRSKKGKRKLPTTEFNNKLVRNFLISIVILLAILLILESAQIFYQSER